MKDTRVYDLSDAKRDCEQLAANLEALRVLYKDMQMILQNNNDYPENITNLFRIQRKLLLAGTFCNDALGMIKESISMEKTFPWD